MSLPKPPAELEFIDTFLQRGRELREREPIVAYYCNYYAAKLAMERGFKSKESEAFLSSLVDLLQEDKKNLASSEAISNDVVAYAHIENFALKIFVNADNEDRAGKASKRTAKTFLAASIFLELLKQFGELDGEIKQKIKYAKFKAADIVKALKEGRIPTAGPPGGDPNDLEGLGGASDLPAGPGPSESFEAPSAFAGASGMPATTPTAGFNQFDQLPPPLPPPPKPFEYPSMDLGQGSFSTAHSPAQPQPPQVQQPHQYWQAPPTFSPVHPQVSGSFPSPPSSTPSGMQPPPVMHHQHAYAPSAPAPAPSPAPAPAHVPMASAADTQDDYGDLPFDEEAHRIMTQAQKHAKFAISALQYEDIKTAVDNLQKALAVLGPLAARK